MLWDTSMIWYLYVKTKEIHNLIDKFFWCEKLYCFIYELNRNPECFFVSEDQLNCDVYGNSIHNGKCQHEKSAVFLFLELQCNPFWEATLTRGHPRWKGHLAMLI